MAVASITTTVHIAAASRTTTEHPAPQSSHVTAAAAPFALVLEAIAKANVPGTPGTLSPEILQQADKLLMNVIRLKHNHSGDDIVLTYKDYRNGNSKSLVNIPKTETDKSFHEYDGWIGKAFEENSKTRTVTLLHA